MRLVIEIDEGRFKDIQRIASVQLKYHCKTAEQIIANGTPLSKGHGDLMVLSKDKLKENQINLDFSCQKWISEVGLSNATVAIIEADKAESDAPNFESEEYVEERIENYDKMLKSGILDCVKEKSQESDGKE